MGARYGDELRRDAGKALRYAAPRQKILAHALSMDPADVSRTCNGHPSALSKVTEHVRGLVREGKASAGTLIAHFLLTAEDEALRLSGEEIRRRYVEACAQEQLLQSHEDVATQDAVVAVVTNAPDMRAKLESQEAAYLPETGAHIDVLIYNRALRVVRGWRVAPGGAS